MCSGVLRQRDPPIFSGTEDCDVDDWLLQYERCSTHNKWDNHDKLCQIIFYLTNVSNLRFHNHEANFTTWSAIKETLTSFFGWPAVRKLHAEHSLRGRSEQISETFTSYSEDVIGLCRQANADMAESDKMRHIMKGIDDDAFHMLVAENPQSVAEVIELSQSFDELRLCHCRASYFCESAPTYGYFNQHPVHHLTRQTPTLVKPPTVLVDLRRLCFSDGA